MSPEHAETLSAGERDVMRHALGLTRARQPYRNYYAVEPETPAGRIWQGLVSRGLARDSGPQSLYAGVHIYSVSPAGRAALQDAEERG